MRANGKLTVTIDGPAAAGKTVVGTRLAKRLGYRFLDTGMMYRAATVAAVDAGADFTDSDQLAEIAERLDISVVTGSEGETRIIVNGQDITHRLRSHDVDTNVSIVSAVPRVRAVMVEAQRRVADGGGMIMVGRDIGTVVLPDAGCKIFLTASLKTRADRRFKEMQDTLKPPGYADVLKAMRRRDDTDSSREMSPLKPADDAVIVETDDMIVEEVVRHLAELADGSPA